MSAAEAGSPPASKAAGANAANPADVAILEPALWRQLGEADGPAARAASWAGLTPRLVPGAHQAVVVLAGTGGFAPAALWPMSEPPCVLLMAAVEAAIEQRKGAVRLGRVQGPAREAAVALPLLRDSEMLGAAAVALRDAGEAGLRTAMRQLQWGAGWLRAGGGETASAPRQVLELLGAAVEEIGFRAAAQRLVTELTTSFGCDRVSLGLMVRGRMRVVTISHSARVEERSSDTTRLTDAMAEASDQRAILRFPPSKEEAREPLARHAQEQLAAASKADD